MAWKFLELQTTDPRWNLAAEQYVFDCLPREHSYFMLWQNEPSVIIGRHQNTLAEINEAYIRQKGIHVVRRLSGGGAVYHDLGNLNFTFIQDAQSTRLDLGLFCRPVAAALQKLGARAEVNGRNDITLDGKKISGNAQYIREGRIMHHGTLLFHADLEAASLALKPPAAKLQSKGVASVRSRMTDISRHLPEEISLSAFKQCFMEQLFAGVPMEPYTWRAEDLSAIDTICAERYSTDQWNYGQSPPCDLVHRGRIEGCGSIELHLRICMGLIAEGTFHGDFFSLQDPSFLASCFVGKEPKQSGYEAALEGVDVSSVIRALSNESLLGLLCGDSSEEETTTG